ncbi:alpha/beta fold hydrolase [Streptomyces sp. NPDC091272]|uniref:alpha/beta fold hydrolase n=1 Tax=Streptomyces sp. NPDC091272 TaxID=3365981 RepID=UPI0037F36C47
MSPSSARNQKPPVIHHHIDVDGTATHYIESGKGSPVLLLHGAGANSGNWLQTVESLSGEHRVVAVDLPGYGDTASLDRKDPAATVAFLWRFAESAGLGRHVVVGHSFGGLLALLMALERPEQVRGVVAVAAGGLGRAISPVAAIQAGTPLGDLTPLLATVPGGPQLLVTGVAAVGAARPWRLPMSWWKSQLKAASSYRDLRTALSTFRATVGLWGQHQSILGRLPELSMPVLVLWGLQDRMVPFWHGVRAARRIPHSDLHLMPCSGHLVINESGRAVQQQLAEFLRKTELLTAQDPKPKRG